MSEFIHIHYIKPYRKREQYMMIDMLNNKTFKHEKFNAMINSNLTKEAYALFTEYLDKKMDCVVKIFRKEEEKQYSAILLKKKIYRPYQKIL